MAHNQFFLLLLGIIIVALAATAGIYAFAEGAARNHQDTIVARSIELVSFSQEWRMRPGMFGGGNGSFEDVDIWTVTMQSGTGVWMEEDNIRYRIYPLRRPNHARLIALDDQLNYQVIIHFDADSIISTDFVTGGVIYIDEELDGRP